MSDGLQQLQAFCRSHQLTAAALHVGLQRHSGKKLGYRRVYSWMSGKRRPDAEGRAILKDACGIDPHAWLTPEEIEGERWIVGTTAEAV